MFKDIDLCVARIEGQTSLTDATINGMLNMNGLRIGSNLFMNQEARFNEVNLVGAKIEGQVDMTCAKVEGRLDMDGIKVGESIFLRGLRKSLFKIEGAQFHEVILRSAQIENQVNLEYATFEGILEMNGIKARQLLSKGAKLKDVNLVGQE